MAAVLAASPAVASHWSAAWLWELLGSRPERIHVTAPTRRNARRPYAVHFAALSDRDLVELGSIPVTSLSRTLLDIAPESRSGQLERCLQKADERGRLDYREVEELLRRARLFRDLIRDAGLPRPSMNRRS